MSYIIHCKICKTAIGAGEDEPPEGDHYCSLHVPKELHDEPGHQYEGARVEATEPLRRDSRK
jgi:hypothetical protein